jgi:hypothetical protein
MILTKLMAKIMPKIKIEVIPPHKWLTSESPLTLHNSPYVKIFADFTKLAIFLYNSNNAVSEPN